MIWARLGVSRIIYFNVDSPESISHTLIFKRLVGWGGVWGPMGPTTAKTVSKKKKQRHVIVSRRGAAMLSQKTVSNNKGMS